MRALNCVDIPFRGGGERRKRGGGFWGKKGGNVCMLGWCGGCCGFLVVVCEEMGEDGEMGRERMGGVGEKGDMLI